MNKEIILQEFVRNIEDLLNSITSVNASVYKILQFSFYGEESRFLKDPRLICIIDGNKWHVELVFRNNIDSDIIITEKHVIDTVNNLFCKITSFLFKCEWLQIQPFVQNFIDAIYMLSSYVADALNMLDCSTAE